MTPTHAYASWRMFELLDGKTEASICEVGGGYGGCAYYSFQRPLRRYTIIDLPIVNLLQGFFLIKTCGADNVCLYGEAHEDRTIHVLPYWMMAEMPDKSFDLTLSQESLPEIEREKAEAYIEQIARTTRRYFLSINQESGAGKQFRQNVVPELVEMHARVYRRRYRFPYWIRKGEVEELYEILN